MQQVWRHMALNENYTLGGQTDFDDSRCTDQTGKPFFWYRNFPRDFYQAASLAVDRELNMIQFWEREEDLGQVCTGEENVISSSTWQYMLYEESAALICQKRMEISPGYDR